MKRNIIKEQFIDLGYQKKRLLRTFDEFNPEDRKRALQALELAERAHRGQVRDEGTQYIIHPIRATRILLEEVDIKDIGIVCALLLHDVVEDTSIDIETIQGQFGSEVARLVKGATREKPANETEKQKAKNKQEKIQALAESDKKIRLIKLCDWLDNRRSQEFIPKNHLSQNKFDRWNKEFRQYIPIAKATNERLYKLFSKYV